MEGTEVSRSRLWLINQLLSILMGVYHHGPEVNDGFQIMRIDLLVVVE